MSTLPHTRKEQEVWQACDDLLAMGKSVKEVTGEAIGIRLRELGYKAGSSTQRYQYRDTWMVARGISREAIEVVESTQSSDPLTRSVAIFREGLERELRHEYDKKIQDLDELLAQQFAQTGHWQAQYESMNQQYQMESQEKKNLADQYMHLQTDFTALQDEKIKLNVQLNMLEKRLSDNDENYKTTLSALMDSHERQMSFLQENLTNQIQVEKEIATSIRETSDKQRHLLLMDLDKLRIQEAKWSSDLENMRAKVQYYQSLFDSLKEQYNQLLKHHEQHQQGMQKIEQLQTNLPDIMQTLLEKCANKSDIHNSEAALSREFKAGIDYLQQTLSTQMAALLPVKTHEMEDTDVNTSSPV